MTHTHLLCASFPLSSQTSHHITANKPCCGVMIVRRGHAGTRPNMVPACPLLTSKSEHTAEAVPVPVAPYGGEYPQLPCQSQKHAVVCPKSTVMCHAFCQLLSSATGSACKQILQAALSACSLKRLQLILAWQPCSQSLLWVEVAAHHADGKAALDWHQKYIFCQRFTAEALCNLRQQPISLLRLFATCLTQNLTVNPNFWHAYHLNEQLLLHEHQ